MLITPLSKTLVMSSECFISSKYGFDSETEVNILNMNIIANWLSCVLSTY